MTKRISFHLTKIINNNTIEIMIICKISISDIPRIFPSTIASIFIGIELNDTIDKPSARYDV